MTPAECQAIRERRMVTYAIRRVYDRKAKLHLIEGTEEEMLAAFSVVRGIVREYEQGGDQLTENCTCGFHSD